MKFLSGLILSFCFLILSPSIILATTFYISPNGNDTNPGTESLPFKTVLKGINTAQEGDTLFIKSGIYDLQKMNVNLYKNISLIGEDKNTTILSNGKRITFHKGLTASNLKFMDWDKTNYDDAVFRPIANTGENIDGVFFDNLITDNINNFIWGVSYGGNINNFNVTNSIINNINTPWHADGIRVDTTGAISNITIRNNTFSNIITTSEDRDAFGILIGSDENNLNPTLPKPTNILIEGNLIEHLVGGNVNPNYPPSGKGIMIYGENITINNNRVIDINPGAAHEGIYIKANNSRITNNILHNGGSGGATIDSGAGDITIKGPGTVFGNIISGNKITSDYPDKGIGIYTKGGVDISNNYIKKSASYFGMYTGESTGVLVSIKDNYVETSAEGGQGIKISAADGGEIAYNVIITYLGYPIYVGTSALNINVHDNNTCRGYNCGILLPLHPSCQNTGNLCCSACQSGSHTEYNNTCDSGSVCCDSCSFGQIPSPTSTSISTPTSTPVPTPKPGDANGDNQVNEVDYAIWLAHFPQQVGGDASVGDFNGDGHVDGIDYTIWLNNYGK